MIENHIVPSLNSNNIFSHPDTHIADYGLVGIGEGPSTAVDRYADSGSSLPEDCGVREDNEAAADIDYSANREDGDAIFGAEGVAKCVEVGYL